MARPTVLSRLAWPWTEWLGPLVAVAVGGWISAPAMGGRPIAGDDVMALLIRADRGISLARNFQIDGWSPDFLLGYQQFLFYGPGFSWAVGAVRVLGVGLPSTEGALTFVAVGSLIALGPATAFLARSIGFDARAAGLAAVLALAVNNVFGLGTSGTFTIALVPHQLAGVFFCLALGAAARTIGDPRRRWVVLLAASSAAIVVTHLFSTVSLAVLAVPTLAAMALTHRPTWAALGRLVAGGLLGAGLAAFWLVPYLAHWGDRGIVPGWSVPPVGSRVGEILDGRLLFGPYRGWLVMIGVAWAAAEGLAMARRGRPGRLVPLLGPLVFLAVGHTLASRFPGHELSPHLANRGLGYAGLLAVLGLAALLADLSTRLRAAGHVGGLAAAAVFVVALPGSPHDAVGQQPEPVMALREAAGLLRRVVPDGARFATERDFPSEIARLGLSHPDFWLARMARRPTLNVFGLELSPSPSAASIPESVTRLVEEGPDGVESLAASLRGAGTTHLVTVKPSTATTLERSANFEKVSEDGSVAVFAVEAPVVGPRQAPATLVATAPPDTNVSRRHLADDRHEFSFDLVEAGTVELAIGWNTRWRASDSDGRNLPLRRSADGGIIATLPSGRTEFVLSFGPDGWQRVGGIVTLITTLGIVTMVFRRPRGEEPEA